MENTIPIHPLDKTIPTLPAYEIQSLILQTPKPPLLSLPGPDPKSPSHCLGQAQASWLLRWTALPGCPILPEDRLSPPCSEQTLQGWVQMFLTGDGKLGRHTVVLKDTWARVACIWSRMESWCLEMIFHGS